MTPLIFNVHGTPGAQGSKRHVGNGRMVEQSKKVKPWRSDVHAAAVLATTETPNWPGPLNGPVEVAIVFRFHRPAGHYGTGRNAGVVKNSAPAYPTTRTNGDVDKLVRSSLDALTAAGVLHDDSIVVRLIADKRWCEPGESPGAAFRVLLIDTFGEVAA